MSYVHDMDGTINLEGMKEAGASVKVREEFQHVSDSSHRRAQAVDLNTYLQFLTFMSRLSPHPPPRREPVRYSRTYL